MRGNRPASGFSVSIIFAISCECFSLLLRYLCNEILIRRNIDLYALSLFSGKAIFLRRKAVGLLIGLGIALLMSFSEGIILDEFSGVAGLPMAVARQ